VMNEYCGDLELTDEGKTRGYSIEEIDEP